MKCEHEDWEMLFCDSGCPLINQLFCQQLGGWVAGIPGISWNSMDPEVPNEVRCRTCWTCYSAILRLNQSIALPAARGLGSRNSRDGSVNSGCPLINQLFCTQNLQNHIRVPPHLGPSGSMESQDIPGIPAPPAP